MSQEVQTQQPRAIKPVDAFRFDLHKMEPQIKAVLPQHMPIERFVRVVMTAVQKTPKLLEVNKASLFAACIQSATDGLLPDGREAAMIPYGQTVQYQPMVAGILKKIRNSGELSSISPHVVHEGDEFDYYIDEKGEHLKHKPNWNSEGKPLCAYCVLITKDGGVYIEVMTVLQIEAIRKRSKSSGSGPWVTDWEEMAKKTVIKRLAKRAPMSSDIDQMFMNEDEEERVTEAHVPAQQGDVASVPTSAEPAKKNSRLSSAMAAKSTSVPTQESIPTVATVVPGNNSIENPLKPPPAIAPNRNKTIIQPNPVLQEAKFTEEELERVAIQQGDEDVPI